MAPVEMVRGSVSYYPFWPGGFPESLPDTNQTENESEMPEEGLQQNVIENRVVIDVF